MQILKDSRLWVAVGVLALSVLIWVVGGLISVGEPPQPLPVSFRLVLLGILYLSALAVWWLMRMQSRRTNEALLSAMGEDRESQASVAAEEKQVKEKFAHAMALLKNHRFVGAQGQRQLFQLPWYMVIGAPGSGKTTAIAQSGLEFPLASAMGQNGLQGAGGTRNCDWWITGEAVLLDTAGRYTTQSSDQVADAKGWHNFLALLRANRKRQPINGALVVLSVDELLNYSDNQWQQHLFSLKARLGELTEQLQQSFPVYLVVTKMDLLTGFREFFDTLDVDEQAQVWGATLPDNAPSSQLADEFVLIAQRLHEQVPHKLRQERDLRRRQAMFHFPWQFEQLKGRLQMLTETVFSTGAFAKAYSLRGLYFTSAMQQGSPIERLFAAVTGRFGVAGSLATTARGSRSLFLKQVFQQVIFPENDLASTNPEQDRRVRLIRVGAMSGSILAGAVFLTIWISGYFVHSASLEAAAQQLDAYELASKDGQSGLVPALDSLQALESAVAVFDQRSHPFVSSLGMYDGSADDAARAAFQQALHSVFLPAFAQALAQELASTGEDYARTYSVLKAYLMLHDPAHRELEFLVNIGQSLAAAENGNAERLAHFMTVLAEEDADFTLPTADQNVIARARAQLQQVRPEERVYWRMQEAFTGQVVELSEELGSSFAQALTVADTSVLTMPVFFTRQVFESLDFSAGSEAMQVLTDDEWVLGASGQNAVNTEAVATAVKRLYAEDYMARWKDIYRNLKLSVPGDMDRYIALVGKLADPVDSPFQKLVSLTVRETDLPPPASPSSELKELAGKLPGNKTAQKVGKLIPAGQKDPSFDPLRDAFGGVHRMAQGDAASKTGQLLLALGDLRQWLSGIQMSDDAAQGASGGMDPSKKLQVLSADLPPPFREWSASLARKAQSAVAGKAAAAMNQGWRTEVGEPCLEYFDAKFPFVPSAKAEAGIDAITDFFKPGGIEEAYVTQNLKKLLAKPQGALPSDETRAAIRQAQVIRQTLFKKGAEAPLVEYTLTPQSMDQQVLKVSVELAGTGLVYSHGPKLPTKLSWPDGGEGIVVQLQLADGRVERKEYPGIWALHRLLRESKQAGYVSFAAGLYGATFKVDVASSGSPFDIRLFSAYECRDSL